MKALPLLVAVLILHPPTLWATDVVDGASPGAAIYSAKSLLQHDPFSSTGTYWMDEQQGLGSPFEAYADMTLDGGGFTLGLVSLDASPVSTFTISSSTGTVSAPFGQSHTRDVAYLGLDQDADIQYWIRNASGTDIFQGTYFGRFDDVTPTFSTTVDTLALNGQIDSGFDFHRPDRNYDVSVLIRESNPEALRVVPEPGPMVLFAALIAAGISGLRIRGRRI